MGGVCLLMMRAGQNCNVHPHKNTEQGGGERGRKLGLKSNQLLVTITVGHF